VAERGRFDYALDMSEPNEAPSKSQLQGMGEDARRLLRKVKDGVLATLSQKHRGYPFNSLVPYALSRSGEPVFLLSGLAQHSKNLKADPHACLFVQEGGSEDPQTVGRVAVLGKVAPVPPAEEADARSRYLAAHPNAEMYFSLGDFVLYQLVMDEVHLVGGFARAGWVSASVVREKA
jgi:putative heme iron utilization protein